MAHENRDHTKSSHQTSQRLQWAFAIVFFAITAAFVYSGGWPYLLVAAIGCVYLSGIWFLLLALNASRTNRRTTNVIFCLFLVYVYGGIRILAHFFARLMERGV